VLDVESFAALLSDCYQRCWLVAAAVTGDRVEADDIVQEASIIALRKLSEFKVGTNFTAWISQIVRLTALNHLKKAGRRGVASIDPEVIERAVPGADPSAGDEQSSITGDGRLMADQSDFDDDVMDALAEMSDEARACLLLRVVQRLTYNEISETLQIPEGTAMSHVHRAKKAMRERLQNRQEPTVAYNKVQFDR
jgi:RNA polymerase sigma-70 factor (ECF subfamily)